MEYEGTKGFEPWCSPSVRPAATRLPSVGGNLDLCCFFNERIAQEKILLLSMTLKSSLENTETQISSIQVSIAFRAEKSCDWNNYSDPDLWTLKSIVDQ